MEGQAPPPGRVSARALPAMAEAPSEAALPCATCSFNMIRDFINMWACFHVGRHLLASKSWFYKRSSNKGRTRGNFVGMFAFLAYSSLFMLLLQVLQQKDFGIFTLLDLKRRVGSPGQIVYPTHFHLVSSTLPHPARPSFCIWRRTSPAPPAAPPVPSTPLPPPLPPAPCFPRAPCPLPPAPGCQVFSFGWAGTEQSSRDYPMLVAASLGQVPEGSRCSTPDVGNSTGEEPRNSVAVLHFRK